jgi:hypothetical protein
MSGSSLLTEAFKKYFNETFAIFEPSRGARQELPERLNPPRQAQSYTEGAAMRGRKKARGKRGREG